MQLTAEQKKENSAKVNQHLFRTIQQWMPGLRENGDGTFNAINPERQDKDPSSMRIYSGEDPHAFDFVSQKRYDMVDLKAVATKSDPRSVFRDAAAELGLLGPLRQGATTVSAKPVILRPAEQKTQESGAEPNIPERQPTAVELSAKIDVEVSGKTTPTHMNPSKVWAYRNAQGVVIAYNRRFDLLDKDGKPDKTFRPLSWIKDKHGHGKWIGTTKGLNGTVPIYGRELLSAKPVAKVLVVEGEKTADSARVLFPELIVITFFGGAGKAKKCDWSCLAGREVIMWPDADQATQPTNHPEAGKQKPLHEQASMKAMIAMAQILEGFSVSSKIVPPLAGVRHKWDLADLDETSYTLPDLQRHIQDNAAHFSKFLPAVSSPSEDSSSKMAPDSSQQSWKAAAITTAIRMDFEASVRKGTHDTDYSFCKDHYFYEPTSERNSKRNVPTFITYAAPDGRVTIVPPKHFINRFIDWYDIEGRHRYGSTPLLENHLVVLANRLAQRLPRMNEPALFKWRGQQGLAWNILNFDISERHLESSGVKVDGTEENAMEILKVVAPAWYEQLSRMTNRLAFMSYMGAIIDPTALPQQYIWLWGKGNDGKSTIIEVLDTLFGQAAMKTEWPDNPNQFFTSQMESRRLLLLDDQKHGHVVRSGLWKSVTGSKTLTIEHKGQSPYVVPNELLVVSASNHRPESSGDRADTRRLIFCECQTHNKVIEDFHKILLQDANPFFSLCWQLWQIHRGQKGTVPVDAAVTRSNTMESFREEADFVAANFELFEMDRIQAAFKSSLPKKMVPHTRNSDLRLICDRFKINFKRLSDYLVQVLGYPPELVSYSKMDKQRVIFGIVPKPFLRQRAGLDIQDFAPLPEIKQANEPGSDLEVAPALVETIVGSETEIQPPAVAAALEQPSAATEAVLFAIATCSESSRIERLPVHRYDGHDFDDPLPEEYEFTTAPEDDGPDPVLME